MRYDAHHHGLGYTTRFYDMVQLTNFQGKQMCQMIWDRQYSFQDEHVRFVHAVCVDRCIVFPHLQHLEICFLGIYGRVLHLLNEPWGLLQLTSLVLMRVHIVADQECRLQLTTRGLARLCICECTGWCMDHPDRCPPTRPNLECLRINGIRSNNQLSWSVHHVGGYSTSLQRLDLAHTGLRNLDGLECLHALRWLDISGNHELSNGIDGNDRAVCVLIAHAGAKSMEPPMVCRHQGVALCCGRRWVELRQLAPNDVYFTMNIRNYEGLGNTTPVHLCGLLSLGYTTDLCRVDLWGQRVDEELPGIGTNTPYTA